MLHYTCTSVIFKPEKTRIVNHGFNSLKPDTLANRGPFFSSAVYRFFFLLSCCSWCCSQFCPLYFLVTKNVYYDSKSQPLICFIGIQKKIYSWINRIKKRKNRRKKQQIFRCTKDFSFWPKRWASSLCRWDVDNVLAIMDHGSRKIVVRE